MLRTILIDATYFDDEDDRERTELDLCWVLEALTQRNQSYLSRRPNTPRLYKSGVVWEAPKQFEGDCFEAKTLRDALGPVAKRNKDVKAVLDKVQMVFGGEHFCDIGVILELGAIDCDGLACFRAAELRQAGIPARPMMTSRPRLGGGVTYHALVRWPPFGDTLGGNPYEESDEDPSLLLGMSQPKRKADRDEEIRKNIERCQVIQRRKQALSQPVDLNAALEDVLGLRRYASQPDMAAIERLLNGGRG